MYSVPIGHQNSYDCTSAADHFKANIHQYTQKQPKPPKGVGSIVPIDSTVTTAAEVIRRSTVKAALGSVASLS